MKLARNLAAEVPIATHLFLGLLQAPQQVCVCVCGTISYSPVGPIFLRFRRPCVGINVWWQQWQPRFDSPGAWVVVARRRRKVLVFFTCTIYSA